MLIRNSPGKDIAIKFRKEGMRDLRIMRNEEGQPRSRLVRAIKFLRESHSKMLGVKPSSSSAPKQKK